MSEELVLEERLEGGTVRKTWSLDDTKAHRSEMWFQGRVSETFYFCPLCNEHISLRDRFCSGCGSELRIPED